MRRYKAFISYSWADQEWARWLHHALETYRAPKGVADGQTLHPIFKDREEEAAGGNIGDAIEAALAASDYLIVICSPRAAASPWVNREIAWFKTHKDKGRILALIVDGEPGASRIPGKAALECFPKALTHGVTDALQPTDDMAGEPLAADARPEGDGKRGARLKLAAALLGVGLDDLVRRDERRRTIRRRAAMGTLAALAAILGASTLFAFNQRNEALKAQKLARAAQVDAEFQRDEAQSLVEFMLTDLRKRLDAVGRLDVLDAVAERLNESYAKQDLSKLDADALGRRARVQLLLGEIDNTRGNLDAALAQYKEAAASTGELLKRNPGKAQQIYDHAQAIFWVGYIAWQRGDADEAKRYFTQYKDYADQLVAIDPDNEDWLAEVEYANSNLGTLAMEQGSAAEAASYFRAALTLASEFAAKHPDDVEKVIGLGQSYAWLADALLRQAKISEARDLRTMELAIYRDWRVNHPLDETIKKATAVALQRFSQIDIAAGDLDSALAHARAAANLAEDLHKSNPESAESLDRAAIALATLGEINFHRGRIEDAEQSITKATSYANQLIARNDAVTLWTGYTLSQPELTLARIESSGKRNADAIQLLNKITARNRRLIDSGARDPSIIRIYCMALAELSRQSGNSSAGWREISTVLASDIPRLLPESKSLLAEALLRTGSNRRAHEIVSELYNAGYRHPDFVALIAAFPELQR